MPTRQVFTREDDGVCAATWSRRAETEERVIARMVVRSDRIGVGCASVAAARPSMSGDVALLDWIGIFLLEREGVCF